MEGFPNNGQGGAGGYPSKQGSQNILTRFLGNRYFILTVSTMCLIAAFGLAFDGCSRILLDDNNSMGGVFQIVLNIYGL